MSRVTKALTVAAVAVVAAASACTPGSGGGDAADQSAKPQSSVTTDASKLGDVTLTVWDQEVRGGQDAQMKKLNEQFQAKYPNITIKRVSRSFDDLQKTLRLALSGNEPPDVVEANNSRSQMGAFVKAGQLIPLDGYAEAYGWAERYPESVRKYSSYSSDGATFGEGSLYGLPQVGEVVGIYVNTGKLEAAGLEIPKTWAEFEQSLPALKAKDEPPLVLGNLDKWPAIHVFGTVLAQTTPADQIRRLGFGQKGATWKTPENEKAASTLQSWIDRGYFNKGVNGLGYDPAWQQFGKGRGTYLIAGTWLQADLGKALGDKVSFILPPPAEAGGKQVAMGGTGLPFSITSKSKNPDAAAAYIDFITSREAMDVLAETDNLPVADTEETTAKPGLGEDVFTAFGTVSKADGLVPYLDYATPTMADTIGAALQDLLAARATVDQFLETLEKDYAGFVGKGG